MTEYLILQKTGYDFLHWISDVLFLLLAKLKKATVQLKTS